MQKQRREIASYGKCLFGIHPIWYKQKHQELLYLFPNSLRDPVRSSNA